MEDREQEPSKDIIVLSKIDFSDRYRNIKSEENYMSLLKSGMFWEFHPELTGNWDLDKIVINANNSLIDKTDMENKEKEQNNKPVLSAIKIGDLPEHTNLQSVRVKLPLHVYKASSLPMYGIKNKPVYLHGWVMGDFFVKTDLKSTQIYPMFWSFVPSDIKEWEVVS